MSAESLMMQAVNITVIGMMIVFTFLVILIGVVKLLGDIVQWAEVRWPSAAAAGAANGTDQTLLAVAIAAAKKFQGK